MTRPDAPPQAPAPARPWPLVVLSFFGALLATLPLLVFLGLLVGDFLVKGPGAYLTGALLGGFALHRLRHRTGSLFLEHLAVVALLLAQGLLVFALVRDLGSTSGCALAACVTVAAALAIGTPWARTILGAGAAGLALATAVLLAEHARHTAPLALVPYVMAALWLALRHARRAVHRAGDGLQALAGPLDDLASGWLAVTLAWTALSTGTTFLLAGLVPGPGMGAAGTGPGAPGFWSPWRLPGMALSAAAAGAAAVLAFGRWPQARSPLALGLAAALALLAALMPPLGVPLAAGVLTLAARRRWQAGAAGLAAAWIVGAAYYQLHWPLATKAAVLMGVGAVLGTLAWWTRPARGTATAAPSAGTALPWALLGVLATLVVANVGIWQKETLIARGERLYVRLGPVDPRSLMQGDYMALDLFAGSPLADDPRLHDTVQRRRVRIAATVDADGVATPQRVLEPDEPAAPGERVLELTPKAGRWVLVTDAWYFREGEAEVWAQARFGELRVDAQGRALLVGLADAQRRPIRPPRPGSGLTPASRPPSG